MATQVGGAGAGADGGKYGRDKTTDLAALRATVAKAILDEFEEDMKQAVAQQLWYEELETIRREEPLFDPKEYPVHDVKILRDEKKRKRGEEERKGGKEEKKSDAEEKETGASDAPITIKAAVVIDLLSSPEPDEQPSFSSGKSKAPATSIPYTTTDINSPDHGYGARKATTLRYHDMATGAGQWPSPTVGLRFDLAAFRRDHGWASNTATKLEDLFPHEVTAASSDMYASRHSDQESIPTTTDFTLGAGPQRPPMLMRGFPLAEEIVFARSRNTWPRVAAGSCYWTAVAVLIYGTPEAWLRVKAEHLVHFRRVLASPSNPRHGLYKELNEKWYLTQCGGGGGGGGVAKGGDIEANLWQVLHLPGVYTPMNMLDVTADLYNVFLVAYSYRRGAVYETRMRGAYNGRHLFLLYVVSGKREERPPSFLNDSSTLSRSRLREIHVGESTNHGRVPERQPFPTNDPQRLPPLGIQAAAGDAALDQGPPPRRQ